MNSTMDAPLMYRILVGEIAASSGVYDLAFGMMLKGAQTAQEPALYERAAQIALQARSGASALQALDEWQKDFPGSKEAVQQKFGLELMLQKTDEASDTLARLVKLLSPSELTELGATLPRLLDRVRDPQSRAPIVTQAMEPLLKDPVRAASASAILGATALQYGDHATALKRARSALQLDPNNLLGLTLAVALLDTGEWSLQPNIEAYLRAPDADLRVRYYFARALTQINQNQQALDALEAVESSPQLDSTALLLMATLNVEQRRWSKAEAQAQRVVDLTESDAGSPNAAAQKDRNTAVLLLAEIAQKQKKWADAEAWLARADEDADPLILAFRRASILASQGQWAEVNRIMTSQITSDLRAEKRLMWMRVQLLKDHDRWEQAYNLLGDASLKYPDDADWVYSQGMVAERLQRYAEMERLMRQHMVLAPEDHQARNALGYSFADRGVRLDEAKALIQEALRMVPNDPFVMDSWGWVLFRLGNHAEAEKVLTQAWLSRADAEIAAHLGEVQWALGRKDLAQATWRQGLALDAENETLRTTMNRFNVDH
ncbi:MAG: hypothetical protein RL357_1150 [Pseudomonadota bacterium]